MKLGYFLGITLVMLLMIAGYGYAYTQRYNQGSSVTATKGIIFQKTLHLNQYKLVSNGNDIWGKYDRYTRSDRHSDTISVYCHEFCK